MASAVDISIRYGHLSLGTQGPYTATSRNQADLSITYEIKILHSVCTGFQLMARAGPLAKASSPAMASLFNSKLYRLASDTMQPGFDDRTKGRKLTIT